MSARDRLYQIQARADAATDGPWDVDTRADDHHAGVTFGDIGQSAALFISDSLGGGIARTHDAVFVAHARQDIPALVDALGAVLDRCSDFDANGNSRELGDPTADTWHEAATIIRRAIDAALSRNEETR